MPGLVGGFGNSTFLFKIFNNQKCNDHFNKFKNLTNFNSTINNSINPNLASYLASLIEGDGTFATKKPHGLAPVYGFRQFSSSSPKNIKPVMVYSNSDTQKLIILKDNRNKSGIYRWTQKKTGFSYVGSATKLYNRFSTYYIFPMVVKILNRSKSHILSAILKYGYSKFTLEILEYCDPKDLIKREQYYLDLLQPEYKLLKFARSSSGKKHSLETRVKMSNSHLGGKNAMFGKIRPKGSGKPSQKIEVLDIKNNITTKYESISAAAKALKTGRTTIYNYLSSNNQKFYKNQYAFKRQFSKSALLHFDSAQHIISSNYSPPVKDSNIHAYLAGLIEASATFSLHDIKSTIKKYRPMIIVVFKKADLPLAQYLQNITNSGKVYIKSDRGYILWQIQDIVGIFNIINFINGYMRTPKIEALKRTINWINEYIINNKFSKLPSTNLILSKIYSIEPKSLDDSQINSNAWLSGFSDADSNFSINIHKRSNKNSIRVQLYYRLEIKQTYHKLDSEGKKVSFFSIMSKLGNFLGVNVLSRSRIKEDKQYYSYTVMAHNKNSLFKIKEYFKKYPLLSSKYLDFKDWLYILQLQEYNSITTSYLDKAINIRKDFNKTRTTYNWDHLNDCYLIKNK
jgi:hypothetical protein